MRVRYFAKKVWSDDGEYDRWHWYRLLSRNGFHELVLVVPNLEGACANNLGLEVFIVPGLSSGEAPVTELKLRCR